MGNPGPDHHWWQALTTVWRGEKLPPRNGFEIVSLICITLFFAVMVWSALSSLSYGLGRLGRIGDVISFSPLPLLLLALVFGVVGRLLLVRRERWPAEGRCGNCGYNRTGLAADAKCPECGASPGSV